MIEAPNKTKGVTFDWNVNIPLLISILFTFGAAITAYNSIINTNTRQDSDIIEIKSMNAKVAETNQQMAINQAGISENQKNLTTITNKLLEIELGRKK